MLVELTSGYAHGELEGLFVRERETVAIEPEKHVHGGVHEADVEGRVFKASNGSPTASGRLTGSAIKVVGVAILEQLAAGLLKTGKDR